MRKILPLCFMLPLLSNAQIFSKVTEGAIVTTPSDSRSCNWIDFDNDGWIDVQITNGKETGDDNMLFKNNGDGTFTMISGQPIVEDDAPSDGATWGDYDNDGDADCFVVNWYGVNNLFYENNGDGSFTQITTGDFVNDGGFSETASWGDYNNDGFIDLYVTNSGGTLKNFLYTNNGDKTFTKVIGGTIVNDTYTSRCVNWTDFDNDGDVDCFVTNEASENENLYQNKNDGTFEKLTGTGLILDHGKTMSASWGDIDNDLDLDVVLVNDQGDESLYRNDGGGEFTNLDADIICNNAGNSFGSNFSDVDNDGDLDLFITNSFWGSKWNNYLYLNNGDGSFVENTTDVVATDSGWSYGNAFGDYDMDGDMDLIVANCYNGSQTTSLYKNETTEMNWLVIDCEGVVSNKSAIGAKVYVKAFIDGEWVWQMREVSAQSGYCGQNMLAAHFGLGNANETDSLIIKWPSGITDIYYGLYSNQYFSALEGASPSSVNPSSAEFSFTVNPNPSTADIQIQFNFIQTETISVSIYNLKGQRVYHLADSLYAEGENQLQINSGLPAGAYLIVCKSANSTTTEHLIITK